MPSASICHQDWANNSVFEGFQKIGTSEGGWSEASAVSSLRQRTKWKDGTLTTSVASTFYPRLEETRTDRFILLFHSVRILGTSCSLPESI